MPYFVYFLVFFTIT